MSLFCLDGERGVFVNHEPKPRPERGAPWRPPDIVRDRCQRPECGRLAMDHWTAKP